MHMVCLQARAARKASNISMASRLILGASLLLAATSAHGAIPKPSWGLQRLMVVRGGCAAPSDAPTEDVPQKLVSPMPSLELIEVSSGIFACAKVEDEAVDALAEQVKSWLYVASDLDDDFQIGAEGFPRLDSYTNIVKEHAPASIKRGLTLEVAQQAVAFLETCPRPVLVSCKLAIRATAAPCMYLAKINGWNVEQTLAYAAEHDFPFLKNEAATEWVRQYVSSLQTAESDAQDEPSAEE